MAIAFPAGTEFRQFEVPQLALPGFPGKSTRNEISRITTGKLIIHKRLSV
jgi:hypothetical protein